MSGIGKIQQQRQEGQKNSGSGGRNRLFLRDGDQALVAIIPDGKDDTDGRLDEIKLHSSREISDTGNEIWRSFLCVGKKCPYCAQGKQPNDAFAMWVFVYSILHPSQSNPEWKRIEQASGSVRYREDVNDFMVFHRGFGRGDALWNQVVDIYSEYGALNKNIVRIKRTGSGRDDTTYTILATDKEAKFSKEQMEKAKTLPAIKDFFRGLQHPSISEGGEEITEVPAEKEIAKKGRKPKVMKKAEEPEDLLGTPEAPEAGDEEDMLF